MKPGPELDAIVAERVMGAPSLRYFWTDLSGRTEIYGITPSLYPKPYSTDIAAAWEVVEKLKQNELSVQIWGAEPNDSQAGFYAAFSEYRINPSNEFELLEHGESAPHAICLAALKALGEKSE